MISFSIFNKMHAVEQLPLRCKHGTFSHCAIEQKNVPFFTDDIINKEDTKKSKGNSVCDI